MPPFPRKQASLPSRNAADLRGASRLTIDAITGVTDLVEAVHANVIGLPGILGTSTTTSTRGIPGTVYRSVRGIARLVGNGIDLALAGFAPLLDRAMPIPQREAVLAAFNGVLGDHLAATGNPLAITMRLRHGGEALVLDRESLARMFPLASPRVLVFAHGLCMNDLQWNYGGHDHGTALADDLGYTPVHLHYNTGLPVSGNARAFSGLLQELVEAWPVPMQDLVIVGHSMGGLVARGACVVAQQNGDTWLSRLRKLVFLGTPHHGAPLERVGSWVDSLIGLSLYTAPFARLGRIRSAGIRDLRHGNIRDEDGAHKGVSHKGGKAEGGFDDGRRHGDGEGHRDSRIPSPLPAHVQAYAVAATTQAARTGADLDGLRGDGLVRIASAFGQHADRRFTLRIPAARRMLVYRTNHLELLGSAEVYARLRRWLA